MHSHTVHLPLGALLSPCAVCGTGEERAQRNAFRAHVFQYFAFGFTEAVQGLLPGFFYGYTSLRATHGALPHRAPSPRCTA